MTVDDQLSRLEDLRGVREVLHRYCRLVDSRDAPAIARHAFSADAVDDHGIYGQSFVGREAIEAMFRASNRTTDSSSHFVSVPVIDLDGDTARARTYVTGWTWVWDHERSNVRPADWVFTGIYNDTLVRTAEGWLIAERYVEQLGPGATGYGARPGAYDKPVTGDAASEAPTTSNGES